MDFLRKYVFHNFALKLLSLASAILLWNAVGREPMAEVTHVVPVEFLHVPEDLTLSAEAVPQAEIWIRGPQRLLREVNPSDLHPTIDLGPELERIRAASQRGSMLSFEIRPGLIRAPRQIEVVQIVPSVVRVGFDVRETRQVPVRPRVVGAPPLGITITRIETDPPEVTIVGPRQHVNAVEAVTTDPVDVSGLSGASSFTVAAFAPDALVRLAGSAQVRVTVITGKTSPGAGK
jgi:hypothetical protein